jgi:tRNA(Arg) A34 adenosine deaminase TadA
VLFGKAAIGMALLHFSKPNFCMKNFLLRIRSLACSLILFASWPAQSQDTAQNNLTPDKQTWMHKAMTLPMGIQAQDSKRVILQKIKKYVQQYQIQKEYPDDAFALVVVKEALQSLLEGGYGIGAVLVNAQGQILEKAHNTQIQLRRSDYHAEMALLSNFEAKPLARKYIQHLGFTGEANVYAPGMVVYSSAEPCPMCFVRLSIVGVDTKFIAAGPDDGMVQRAGCLPPFWKSLSEKHQVTLAQSSPAMQQLSHLLFYSFVL